MQCDLFTTSDLLSEKVQMFCSIPVINNFYGISKHEEGAQPKKGVFNWWTLTMIDSFTLSLPWVC